MPSMKIYLEFNFRHLFFLLAISGLITSCVPQKEIKYLQKQQERDTLGFYPNKRNSDRKVQPKDNLYIRVYTLDEKASGYFNKLTTVSGATSYNDYTNDASIYLNSYNVNNDGTIDFPIIGKVFVQNMTVNEIKNIIQAKIDEYLKETMVVVKIVNFKITFVGEITRPGQYSIYKDDITIFEALSLAGDMTEFSNRKKVTLIRQTYGGSKVVYLNMNSDQILSSDYYYLQPNDIIYVMQLGYKRMGLGSTFAWAFIFSAITTTLLLINYFK